jgi:hypothetical protein
MSKHQVLTTRDRVIAVFANQPNAVFERAYLCKAIGITDRALRRHLNPLVAEGTIERLGPGIYGRYHGPAVVVDSDQALNESLSTSRSRRPLVGRSDAVFESIMGTLLTYSPP